MSKATTLDAVLPQAVQRWSAADYAKNGRFVQEMAGAVFAMLVPKPGERVLDLGCGDGSLTEEIKAAGSNVLGVDLSDELLAVARMKGLTVRKMDGHALDFVSQFDAVFSNAALHWMRKPKLVIAGVYRALRSRGRFVAELGGHGNVAAIATAMRAVSRARNGDPSLLAPWFFPTVDECSRHLTEAGFSVKEIALVPRPRPAWTVGSGPSADRSSTSFPSRRGQTWSAKWSSCYGRRSAIPRASGPQTMSGCAFSPNAAPDFEPPHQCPIHGRRV